jgi:hypothetical protein
LQHQRQPPGGPPGPDHPHPRPLVGLPVDRQARQFQRRWRRPALDGRDPGRLEDCSPSCGLKFFLPGQYAAASMRLAHSEFFQSQSSARASIALDGAAEPTTRSARSELGLFSRFEKRSRSRLAAAIGFRPLAQPALLARTPRRAREEIPIRDETLLREVRHRLKRRQPNPSPLQTRRRECECRQGWLRDASRCSGPTDVTSVTAVPRAI